MIFLEVDGLKSCFRHLKLCCSLHSDFSCINSDKALLKTFLPAVRGVWLHHCEVFCWFLCRSLEFRVQLLDSLQLSEYPEQYQNILLKYNRTESNLWKPVKKMTGCWPLTRKQWELKLNTILLSNLLLQFTKAVRPRIAWESESPSPKNNHKKRSAAFSNSALWFYHSNPQYLTMWRKKPFVLVLGDSSNSQVFICSWLLSANA